MEVANCYLFYIKERLLECMEVFSLKEKVDKAGFTLGENICTHIGHAGSFL